MEVQVNELLIVPVVLGLVEVAKRFGPSDKLLPVLALMLGVIGAFVFPEATPPLTALKGLVYGLAASGLFSGGKTLIK
jgi:hypothetical protein